MPQMTDEERRRLLGVEPPQMTDEQRRQLLGIQAQPEEEEGRSFSDRYLSVAGPAQRERVGGQIASIPGAVVGASEMAVQTAGTAASESTESFFSDPLGDINAAANLIRSAVTYPVKVLTPTTPEAQRAGTMILEMAKQAGKDIFQTGTDPAKALEERGLMALFDVADLALMGIGLGGASRMARGVVGARKIGRQLAKEAGEEVVEEVVERGAKELLLPTQADAARVRGAYEAAGSGTVDDVSNFVATVSWQAPESVGPQRAVKAGVGMDLGKELPKRGEDVLAHAMTPPAGTIADAPPWVGHIMDWDKAMPEGAAILRPVMDAMNDEVAVFADKYKKLTKGIRVNSRFDNEISRLLNGEFGEIEDLLRSATVYKDHGISKRSVEVAAEARRDLDVLFHRLKAGPIPDLNYNKHYITFIREQYGVPNLAPPELLRYGDRKAAFRFMKRSDAAAPEDLSFITSMQTYIPAAVRKIHMDPAFKQLDELRGALKESGAATKLELLNNMEDYLVGKPGGLERALDRKLIAVGESLGIDVGPRISLRMSMGLAGGFYRGILGGNISASLNNMTQSVNTMAAAGVMPTMEGVARFLSPSGKGVKLAREANLQRDWKRLFEENRRFGSSMATFDDIIFAPFNFAEFFNRGIAFHTGVGKALKDLGLSSIDEVTDAAMRADIMRQGQLMSQQTQFVYDELSRATAFRGPLGRQLGVLTSFPIKQTQFLNELRKNNKGGLLRYFLVTGMSAWLLEEQLGVEVNALSKERMFGLSLPAGWEFISQLEGAPLAASPPGQVAKWAGESLQAAMEGDPVSLIDGVSRLADGLTNAIPLAVASKEVMRSFQDGVRGERKRRTGRIPFAREFGPDALEKLGLPREWATRQPLGTIIGPLAGLGGVLQGTTPGREVMRAIGLKPSPMAEEEQFTQDLAVFVQRRNAGKAKANVVGGFMLMEGQDEAAREVFREGGSTRSGVRSSVRSSQLPQALRMVKAAGPQAMAEFLVQHPEYKGLAERVQREAMARRRQQR